MKSRTNALIIKHRNKLNKLVEKNEDYKKILKQSRKLDKYINQYIKENEQS